MEVAGLPVRQEGLAAVEPEPWVGREAVSM